MRFMKIRNQTVVKVTSFSFLLLWLAGCSKPVTDYSDMSVAESAISKATGCEWVNTQLGGYDSVRACTTSDENFTGLSIGKRYESLIAAYAFNDNYEGYVLIDSEYRGGIMLRTDMIGQSELYEVTQAFGFEDAQIDSVIKKEVRDTRSEAFNFTAYNGFHTWFAENNQFLREEATVSIMPLKSLDYEQYTISEIGLQRKKEQEENERKKAEEERLLAEKAKAYYALRDEFATKDQGHGYLFLGQSVNRSHSTVENILYANPSNIRLSPQYFHVINWMNVVTEETRRKDEIKRLLENSPNYIGNFFSQSDPELRKRVLNFRQLSVFEKEAEKPKLLQDLENRINEDRAKIDVAKEIKGEDAPIFYLPIHGRIQLKYDFEKEAFIFHRLTAFNTHSNGLKFFKNSVEGYSSSAGHVYTNMDHSFTNIAIPVKKSDAPGFVEKYGRNTSAGDDIFEFNYTTMFRRAYLANGVVNSQEAKTGYRLPRNVDPSSLTTQQWSRNCLIFDKYLRERGFDDEPVKPYLVVDYGGKEAPREEVSECYYWQELMTTFPESEPYSWSSYKESK
jgi:hypothetical protein